jgi:drug/metabolite transporter (DMT)-like permease
MIGWSMFFGALLITPFAFFNIPSSFPKTETILSLLWLGIISTGVAYLGYVRLIERIGAVRTSTVTYLIPAFGILWGSIFLDEQITLIISIGFILILLGIYFSNSSAKEN